MSNGHGGARPGAGRKPKTEKHETAIAAAEQQIADRLPALVDQLFVLAMGGWEQVSETWEPAGLVTIGSGEAEAPAFPGLPADTLVRTKRTFSIAAPDRTALMYLADRVMGKPKTQVEGEVTVNAGDALIAQFGQAVTKIYGTEDEHPGDSPVC